MQAFAEGKQIQDKIEGVTDWVDTDEINFEYEGQKIKHRIKPQQKYRPFETKEECWLEMHKHPYLGWVAAQDSKVIYHINIVGDGYIHIDGSSVDFSTAYSEYEFLDGTPFGIKEK